MDRNRWIYLATTTAITVFGLGVVRQAAHAEPAAQAQPQTVPGSAAPAATKEVKATATATAVVPDAANTPLAIRVDDPSLKWNPCPAIFPEGCRIAVLHGDPSKPGADVYLQVPGGYRIPAHTHSSAERMVLVSGELEVRYQGRSAVVLQAGQYAYGPAKVPHLAACRSQAACTLFITFDGPVDALAFEGQL
jgi:quercetin dioxygenase-like cupin family protein